MSASARPFRLYNTLTRRVEEFAPEDGDTVRMYACGPTVYQPAHLGNFRTFLFVDLLSRALALRGWRVQQVMNLTDVDDKIIRKASAEGVTIDRITEPMTAIFHRDREYLRIRAADRYPKATEHIPHMIAIIERLMARGVAYQAEDGSVYYAIAKFPDYGKLSELDRREIKVGARVAQDDYTKENAQDFALWKRAKEEDEVVGAAWDSPWGRGRPGWHIECSAMAMAYLGETLDIHCGGVDLKFPHHEDEIAQSEAATGVPFSRFWCHGEFLLTEGAKMAKRVGNVASVSDLREQGVPGVAYRLLAFQTRYRQQLNLRPEALEAAMEGVRRIGTFGDRLREAAGGTPELARAAEAFQSRVTSALFDDLNAPEAVAALFDFIRDGNAELDRGGRDAGALTQARDAFERIDAVLDLVPAPETVDPQLAAWVEARLAERREARARRDFAAADRIRAELDAKGVRIEDTPSGTKWHLGG